MMNAPNFLSLEFHTRYFPGILLSRMRLGGRKETGFSSTLEHYIAFAVCIILLAFGIPVAVSSGSIIGWITGGIGAAGTLALVINSVLSRTKEPPSYEGFLAGVFLFFVFLGITSGVFVGTLEHSLSLGLMAGSAGLIAGYPLGILAGLWLQYLGWLSATVNGLAGLAVVGVLSVDLVLLSGVLFG
jgi:hypothetical protein